MNSSGMGVIPPGGVFTFYQILPNGTFFQHTAATRELLVQKVRDFRIQNNIPLGHPETEVDSVVDSRLTPRVKTEERSLRERVTGWKANRSYQKLSYVDQQEAERRTKICADCPFNRRNFADDCLECYIGVERDLFAMRQGRKTNQDEQLGACVITGQENKTAAHLEERFLLHRVNYKDQLEKEYHKCWLLQLDNNTNKEVD